MDKDKEDDLEMKYQDVKIPAIQLFQELGKLFDKELKHLMTGSKETKKAEDSTS